jgi:hypothetical protein
MGYTMGIYLGYLTDMILAVQKWSLPHDDHTWDVLWLSYCGWKKKSCSTNRMVATPINNGILPIYGDFATIHSMNEIISGYK